MQMRVTRFGVDTSFGNLIIRRLALGGKEGRRVVGDQQQWEQGIEWSLSGAGCDLNPSFEGYLVISHDGERVSLLAHRELWGTDEPLFELLDHEEMTTYWVDEGRLPSKLSNCSRSMASLPRREICPKGQRRPCHSMKSAVTFFVRRPGRTGP